MKIRVIQPPYPMGADATEASIAFILKELAACDESLDLVVLPECCNAPSACGDYEQLKIQVGIYSDTLLNAVKETAVRCQATVILPPGAM